MGPTKKGWRNSTAVPRLRDMAASRYVAPFGPNGSMPLDPALARRLLSTALQQGGDYADLFFEYGASGSYCSRRASSSRRAARSRWASACAS